MLISENLATKLDLIPVFTASLIRKITILPVTKEDIFDIKLVLEEALVNAMRYGNKLNPVLFVTIAFEANEEFLTIKVIDKGKGFDFKNIPDPTEEKNLDKLSGRGIFLIKRLMDKVDFFDGGRCIVMTKFFKKEARSEYQRRENQ